MTTSTTTGPLLPHWLRRITAYGVVFLVLTAAFWVIWTLLLRVALVSGSIVAALLLAALLAPLHARLLRLGLPRALGALLSTLLLLALPIGVLMLLGLRASSQLDALSASLTNGIDQVRAFLVDGPLSVDPVQVDRIRDTAVRSLEGLVPQPVGGVTTVLRLLGAVVLVLFAVFFLLKDGPQMWRWFLRWVPARRRVRTDAAGRTAWDALGSYARGTVLIALADATLIGAGLLVLGVPLWLSLTLLTFLGAFVPLLGATVAGAAAVLVTFVTNGIGDAVIVLVIVIAVQQIEGNLLQPFVMGHALSLHPLAIVTAVSAGSLLLGIMGAVLAVPLVAVVYQVAASLADVADSAEQAATPSTDG